MEQQFLPNGDLLHDHHYFWLPALGRLKPGIPLEQAQQELTALLQPMVRQYPEEHKGHETVTLAPLWRGPFGANAFFATLLPMLMAISGVVLLLTCANVANLLLVRSVARRREIAIRLSMGASRWRLLRQLLIESFILSLAGGFIALELTLWTSGSLMLFVPPVDFPVDLAVNTDRTVLLATLVISILTGVIFGVLPALRATGIQPAAVLKEETRTSAGGRGKARLTSALVVVQISLSLLLLICAGLFIRSFVSAQRFNPGFNSFFWLLTICFRLAITRPLESSSIASFWRGSPRCRASRPSRSATAFRWAWEEAPPASSPRATPASRTSPWRFPNCWWAPAICTLCRFPCLPAAT